MVIVSFDRAFQRTELLTRGESIFPAWSANAPFDRRFPAPSRSRGECSLELILDIAAT